MKCPYCSTENRDDRESCYHCGKDISMLRLLINKARHHYNTALEHAERQRYAEALAELRHALDLDYSFAPAHVVMGTVYARMEQYGEAERCWRQALALDPHILKAHEYVSKTPLVQQAGPLLRQLKRAAVAVVAVFVVFVLATLWQLRPSRDRRAIRNVMAQVESGAYDAALGAAEALRASARRAEIREAAGLIAQALAQRYETAAIEMTALLLDDKPIAARALYGTVTQNRGIPDRYRRQLRVLAGKAAEGVTGTLEEWLKEYEANQITFDNLLTRAAGVQEVFDEPQVMEALKRVLDKARMTMVAREIESIPDGPVSTTETLTWLSRLEDLARRVPQARDLLTSATQQMSHRVTAQVEADLNRAADGGDPDALSALLDDLVLLRPHADPATIDALTIRAQEHLRRIEARRLAARLEKATVAEIPEIDRWLEQFERRTSTTVESNTELAAALGRTRRRLAYDAHRWLTARDQRFERGQVTQEEARFAVERAQFVLDYVVGGNWRYVRDNTVFYAAVGWLILGEKDKALSWFDRLEREFPESSYLPLARRYREQAAPSSDQQQSENP